MIDAPARHPGAALGLAALLTVGAILGVLRVEPEVDFIDTVPQHEGLDAYRDMLQRLDGIRFVAIYMADAPTQGHLRDPDTFDLLIQEQADLTEFIEQRFPGAFSHQLSALEAMKAGHYMLEKIATAGNPRDESYSVPDDPVRYQLVRDQTLGDDSIDDVVAHDGSSALMLFFFATKDNLEARHLSGEVAAALADWDGAQVTQDHAASGLLYSSQYTDDRNGHDLRVWGLVAAGAATLAMLWVLRRPSHVAIAVGSMALATTWAFGLTGWLDIRVSFLTLFLAPVVMGIGIDAAVHLLHRAEEERDIPRAVRRIGPTILIAGLTTAAGLAVLMLVPNPLFAEIGGVAALGILMALLATFLVAAPLARLLPPGRPRHQTGIPGAARRRPLALVAVAVVTVLASLAATQTTIESGSAENEFPQDDPVIRLQHRIEEEYGAFQRAYIIVRGDITDPDALRAMHEAGTRAAELPLHREATSVTDLLLADAATDGGAADLALEAILAPTPAAPDDEGRLPQTRAEAQDALDALFADPLWRTIAPFTITDDYDLAVVAITLDPWQDQDTLRTLRDALQTQAQVMDDALPFHEVVAAGSPVNRAAVIDQTPINITIATVGTAVAVTGILAIAWRHRGLEGLRVAAVGGGMVLLAAWWLIGAVVGLDLFYEMTGTFNNAVLSDMFLLAFAITVAIGVDDLVHIAGRFWEARDAGHLDPLRESFQHAGRAITGTTLTTFLAFAVLGGVYFLQSKNLAILTAIGAASAYALTLALAPWVLRSGAPAQK